MNCEKHFPANLHSLKNMMEFVKEAVPNFPMNFELALEEALVNICSYAYPHHEGTVLILVEYEQDEVLVRIIDEGIAYDPIGYLKQPKKTEIGGLGIHLISKMAQKLHYERKEEKNILSLHFNLF
jgi:anti-sigma regulatory factor (Ser/Thr protein kinase)